MTAETILDIAKELHVHARVEYCGETFTHTPERRDGNRRPLYCCLFGGHAFFYDQESVLRSLERVAGGATARQWRRWWPKQPHTRRRR